MNIKSIIAAESADGMVVVSVDAPMSEDILNALPKYLQPMNLPCPDLNDGKLIFSDQQFNALSHPEHLKAFNACLTQAEQEVNAGGIQRRNMLDNFSKRTGVPIE